MLVVMRVQNLAAAYRLEEKNVAATFKQRLYFLEASAVDDICGCARNMKAIFKRQVPVGEVAVEFARLAPTDRNRLPIARRSLEDGGDRVAPTKEGEIP